MQLIYRPEVLGDIVEAADFYEQQEPGLGDEVADFLHAELQSLKTLAGIHNHRKGIYQCVIGGRFPHYVAYYQMTSDSVTVVGVFDHRRNPTRIKSLLRDRL